MCQVCEVQFDTMLKGFDATMANNMDNQRNGLLRDTPATRVHDLVRELTAFSRSEFSNDCILWYLAIAIERLMALENSGIPT